VIALVLWLILDVLDRLPPSLEPAWTRGLFGCVVLFAAIVAASMVQREADQQIVDEIEAERHTARGVALRELAGFSPAMLVGVGLLILILRSGTLGAPTSYWLGSWQVPSGWLPNIEAGLQSIAAMVLAAGLGWGVRILATLAFGKEAFGTGDIYILAAIAAVLGFWAVFFAFFLAAILALAAYPIIRLSKHSRAIPFGPWLSLAAFCLLWLYGPLLRYFSPPAQMIWSSLQGQAPP
jgi:prepilin signal peptidase PulO-like enzyme (type II secretory pathway)